MNRGPIDFVEGAAQVADDYGGWPELHDGQLLSLSLDSQAEAIEASFDLLDVVSSDSTTTILALRWEGVTDFQFASTNLDGVLYKIAFSEVKGGTETQFLSKTGGLTGRIRAARIKVTRYEPGEE